MPKISYKQLTKYLEGYKKMENPTLCTLTFSTR